MYDTRDKMENCCLKDKAALMRTDEKTQDDHDESSEEITLEQNLILAAERMQSRVNDEVRQFAEHVLHLSTLNQQHTEVACYERLRAAALQEGSPEATDEVMESGTNRNILNIESRHRLLLTCLTLSAYVTNRLLEK